MSRHTQGLCLAALLWLPLSQAAAAPAAGASAPAGVASAASNPSASMAAKDISLSPAQVKALGIVSQPLTAEGGALRQRLPGVISVPEAQQRVLAAPLPGLVERLTVSVGEEVRAGQVLAVLRSTAALELQRDARTAASQAELAASSLARDEQLHAEGLIATSRLDSSRAQARQARWLADERQRALAEARVASSNGLVTLTAPISGSVVERQASVGQRVEASMPLLRIASMNTLWVELQVPAAQARHVKLGDEVLLDDGSRGRVIALGRAVDPQTQSVMVRASLSPAPPGLRIGEAVTASLDNSAPGQLSLPALAVVEHDGRSWAFVEVKPGLYRPTPLSVGAAAGSSLRVSGLSPANPRVVVQGTAALKALISLTATPAGAR